MVTFDDSFSKGKLASLHIAEAERYTKSKASQLGYNYVNLQGYTINPAALATIPEQEAKQGKLVGFELKQKNLSVAVHSPTDSATIEVIENLKKERYNITIFMASEASLHHAWKRYQDIKTTTKKQKGVLEIEPEKIASLMQDIHRPEDVGAAIASVKGANSARRISDTVQVIFAGALALRASDIHIEPEEDGIRLRYRFDGILHDVYELERFMHERLMSRFKLLSGMKLNRSAEAQDGRFTFNLGSREIEIRSSVIPGAVGESIVMRILDPTVASFSLENIQLSDGLRAKVVHELKKPNGLILTTGPTGSGKTTVLYAFLRETHKEGVKIITIENPVEYKLDGIVQTQIEGEYTFAKGLRAILRQDPDIIMVGEIRDPEVAETAIHAAQTGHLVFSTLHTNNAIATFTRLIDLNADPIALCASVNIVLGQRLVRVLCKHCRRKRAATPTEVSVIKTILETHPEPPTLSESIMLPEVVGCSECNQTGFTGRTAIFEAVLMDEHVEEAIVNDPREHIIAKAAAAQGIPTMAEDGIVKVLQGITTFKELERVIELPNPHKEPTTANQPTTKATPNNSVSDDDFSAHIV